MLSVDDIEVEVLKMRKEIHALEAFADELLQHLRGQLSIEVLQRDWERSKGDDD